jgi:hypothetical protein
MFNRQKWKKENIENPLFPKRLLLNVMYSTEISTNTRNKKGKNNIHFNHLKGKIITWKKFDFNIFFVFIWFFGKFFSFYLFHFHLLCIFYSRLGIDGWLSFLWDMIYCTLLKNKFIQSKISLFQNTKEKVGGKNLLCKGSTVEFSNFVSRVWAQIEKRVVVRFYWNFNTMIWHLYVFILATWKIVPITEDISTAKKGKIKRFFEILKRRSTCTKFFMLWKWSEKSVWVFFILVG